MSEPNTESCSTCGSLNLAVTKRHNSVRRVFHCFDCGVYYDRDDKMTEGIRKTPMTQPLVLDKIRVQLEPGQVAKYFWNQFADWQACFLVELTKLSQEPYTSPGMQQNYVLKELAEFASDETLHSLAYRLASMAEEVRDIVRKRA